MSRVFIQREPPEPANVVKDRQIAKAWREGRLYCWLGCGRHGRDVHHIVGYPRRSDEHCNFAWFCRQCHEFVERKMEPVSSVRLCLYLKLIHDRLNYDRRRIEQLFGRRLDQ